ncbi:protein shisa-5-like isoform X2 [Pimephales promelas]|uniref:protein shisa-5-like isoform X2 n=1 Tax=Pimephales promelas TaxID=90988 RepID=UPI001955F37F|nr:protein shisa-5-like isoform X2 [Pimephales promelas]
MASTVAVLLLLSAGLFSVGFGDDCMSYISSSNEYKPFIRCQIGAYCCGTCNDRYCCSNSYRKITDQYACKATPTTVVGGTHVTTIVNTQCVQPAPPVMQPAQYPAYKPEPTHPGYGAQPMQTGPYQGQPYAPGPPPPYHMAASPGYPSVQAPYDGSQATYPMMPPAQPGSAYPPPVSFEQPAYNPAYMQPPKTGY